MAGRPPKPTALKILTGNPGHRPLPKNEPMPERGAAPPAWMPLKARKEWDRLAPVLDRLGVLTEVDGEALAELCAARAKFQEVVREEGRVPTELWRAIQAMEARFGLTPSDRARVSAEPKDKSKLGKYLSGQRSTE